MTDLEKFTELYHSVGIELEVEKRDLELQTIRLRADWIENSKFDGYYKCYSTITFDKNGKFVMQGFWDD